MPEIRVRGLVKDFGAQRALDAIDFTVRDGEFLTLLGPSGCGKSTTLMCIAGLLRPDAGLIACGDQVFYEAAAGVNVAAERRSLGIVFQSYAIWPHMTVFENVAFPLRLRKVERKELARRVAEVLDLVEMAHLASRYPHQLSGGQQQRVAMARALSYSPKVLLLDEPFSNLDAKLRERARGWMAGLQRQLALTTVFVTHDQDEALAMSDRVVAMDHGRILQIGSPETIYKRPNSRFVAEFVGQCNLFAGRVSSSRESDFTFAVADSSIELCVDGDAGNYTATEVLLALRPEAIEAATEPRRDSRNCFAAQIQTATYLGDHYLCELLIGGIRCSWSTTRLPPGDHLTVRLPPDAFVLVHDDGRADQVADPDAD